MTEGPRPAATAWRRLLTAIARSSNGRELPAPSRLREGWPRAALILLVPLPALIAGPIRYSLALPMSWAFGLAALLSLALLAPFVPALRHEALAARQALVANLVLVALALFAALVPYNHHFHGLPSYSAPDGLQAVDGGFHVANFWEFVRRSPAVYSGCVSLYSAWDAARRLGSRHLVVALGASFAFVRVVIAAAPCVIGFVVLRAFRDRPRAWLAGTAALVAAGVATQVAVILPLENFHLMGGFWPHLFGLVPLAALWLADAMVRPRVLRVAALLGAVALYRFTYALNLADVCFAVGAILVWEALGRGLSSWARAFMGVSALGNFYAARVAFAVVASFVNGWGWIVSHDVAGARAGALISGLAIGLSLLLGARQPAEERHGVVRALRFPLLFGVANAIGFRLILRPTTSLYYLQKYDFHAIVLLACACVVVVAHAAACLVARLRPAPLVGIVTALTLAVAGQTQLHRALAAYQPAFREQALGAPFQRSYPWVMPTAVERMARTLASEHKSFGGYLSKHWPMLLFTNALFDHADPAWLAAPHVEKLAGQCIFWDGGGRWPDYDALPEKECHDYVQQPWGRYEVCAACY